MGGPAVEDAVQVPGRGGPGGLDGRPGGETGRPHTHVRPVPGGEGTTICTCVVTLWPDLNVSA